MYTYIDENFEKIRDASKVLCVKPFRKEGGFALCAIIFNEQGKYELVQLSKVLSPMFTPFEPMIYFQQQVGRFYMQNFIVIDNYFAFNKQYFSGFGYADAMNKNQKCLLFARFKDGSGLRMSFHKKSKFIQKQIYNYRKILIDNEIAPKSNQPSTTPLFIEDYLIDNISTIPNFKNSESEME